MDIRQYIDVVRRRWRALVLFVLIGALTGATLHLARTPHYDATAELLLLPNDPAERVDGRPTNDVDLNSYAATQISVITARDVATRAAEQLGTTAEAVQDAIAVSSGDSPSVLIVTARSTEPSTARDIANAVVAAFIAERRETQVNALTTAAREIGVQLESLAERIRVLQGTTPGAAQPAALAAAVEQYTTLTVRQSDLRVESTLKRGEARVLTDATIPDTAIGTSLPVDVVLGSLLGLVLGLGLVFARDQLDDRIRGRQEIERLTGMPVLAELPRDRASARQPGHLAIDSDPLGMLAEATRGLRTSVNFLGVDEPIRRIMVTSGLPSEGKTLVATNLAAAFAQAGVSTVLVSADLRKPRLEQAMGLPATVEGLSTVLVSGTGPRRRTQVLSADGERAELQRALLGVLLDTGIDGVSVLPAGPPPPNPAELLASRHMAEVLEQLEQMFDLVIIDTSPVLAVTDAAALASVAEHVLVVASLGMTRRRALERTLQVLVRAQANVLGIVLNRTDQDPTLGAGRYYGRTQEPARKQRIWVQDKREHQELTPARE